MEENAFTDIPDNQRKWYEDFNQAAGNIGQGIGGFVGGIFGGVIDPLKSETKTQTVEQQKIPAKGGKDDNENSKDAIFIAIGVGLVVVATISLILLKKK